MLTPRASVSQDSSPPGERVTLSIARDQGVPEIGAEAVLEATAFEALTVKV